jgi:hypothetical protein
VGKIKKHCPSLYFSLSTWERDQLDPTNLLEPESVPDAFSGDGTNEGLVSWGWGGDSEHHLSCCRASR